MSQDSNKLNRELKFIEDSLKEGIITQGEYEIAKRRVEEKLIIVKKEEEEEAREEVAKVNGDNVNQTIDSLPDGPEGGLIDIETTSLPEEKIPDELDELSSRTDSFDTLDMEKKEDESHIEVYYDEKLVEEKKEENYDKGRQSEKINQAVESTEKTIEKPEEKPLPKKKGSSYKLETYGKKVGFHNKSTILIIISIILLIIIVLFSLNSGNNVNNDKKEKFIPVCEADLDCYKSGFFGKCLNASTESAECAFEAAISINISIITSENCALCDTNRMKNTLSQLYPGSNFKVLDISDSEAKKLISRLNIGSLPAYIFDKGVEETKRFESVKSTLSELNGLYLMKPGAAGSSYFFNSNEKDNQIDLFIYPFASSSIKAFENLMKLTEGIETDYNIMFYTRKDIDIRDNEVYELLRQVCIRDYSDDKFISYLGCIFEDEITEAACSTCLDNYNIPSDLIDSCVENKGKELINEDIKLADRFSINTVPVFLINNQYKKGGSLSVDILKDTFCEINPSIC